MPRAAILPAELGSVSSLSSGSTAGPPPGPQTGSTASADGVPIHYESRGRGERALVFVHCWSCDRHLWDGQVAHFSDTRRVVTLDLAGHGQSGRQRQAWTIEAYGQDVQAVVQALGLRRVVLIGHSMGGPVILEAARRLPDRVAGLVPVDTLADVDEPPPAELQAMLEAFRADYRSTAERMMREWMFVPTTDKNLIEKLVGAVVAASPQVAVPSLEATWRYDARPALREIKAPIHALNGDKWPTDLEAARRHAPRYRLTVLDGVGHYLMLEKPAEFNRLLEQVLRDLGV